jgi:hypothetical protein
MGQLFGMMMTLTVGGTLSVPLLYGISTLCGMQHKKVYPLLRYVKPDGGIVVVQTVGKG